MSQPPPKDRPINSLQCSHYGVVFFAVQLAPDEKCAKHWNQRQRKNGRADHREGFRKRQRMEHLAFHPGESEYRHERKNDDHHGKEDRASHDLGSTQCDLPYVIAIFPAMLFRVLLRLSYDV